MCLWRCCFYMWKVLSGSQTVLFLFGVLHSTCVLFPSPRKDCAASRTQNPSVSKTFSDFCHTAHFLISRHRQMLLMMLGKTRSLVGTHEVREIQAIAVLSGRISLVQHHVWDPIWCHQVDRWELMMKWQYKNPKRHLHAGQCLACD